ncbi:hypothetical protein CAC42_8114 [Sphaceloma murrayae]|uniref:Uncharacterized protein n=1 Tax=Sphaceloma murrayae TaxID=2082308 RepID=A0A2K1QRA9_9PEZI|nr:hypothetical protein CAC42_8114 [Sphaceloma murrayae]
MSARSNSFPNTAQRRGEQQYAPVTNPRLLSYGAVTKIRTEEGERRLVHKPIADYVRAGTRGGDNDGFQYGLKIRSEHPFTVVQRLITSGEKAGTLVFEIAPTKAFNFEGLPIEIKNIILDLVLVDDAQETVIRPMNAPSSFRRWFGDVHVNRNIRQLATPIYYGRNFFSLATSAEAVNFLESCGHGVPHIRHLAIGDWKKAAANKLIGMFLTTDMKEGMAAVEVATASDRHASVQHPPAKIDKSRTLRYYGGDDEHNSEAFREVMKTWVRRLGNDASAVEEVISKVIIGRCMESERPQIYELGTRFPGKWYPHATFEPLEAIWGRCNCGNTERKNAMAALKRELLLAVRQANDKMLEKKMLGPLTAEEKLAKELAIDMTQDVVQSASGSTIGAHPIGIPVSSSPPDRQEMENPGGGSRPPSEALVPVHDYLGRLGYGAATVTTLRTAEETGEVAYVLSSGNSVPENFVSFDGFHKTIILASDRPFTVTQETIHEGANEGSIAFVVKFAEGFRFLDLPIELQYMILSMLVLNERKEIAVGFDLTHYFDRSARALLQVSREVRRVSGPLYYANNYFDFDSTADAVRFLDQRGQTLGAESTRYMTIQFWQKNTGLRLIRMIVAMDRHKDHSDRLSSGTEAASTLTPGDLSRPIRRTSPDGKFQKICYTGGRNTVDEENFIHALKTWVRKLGDTTAAVEEVVGKVLWDRCVTCERRRDLSQRLEDRWGRCDCHMADQRTSHMERLRRTLLQSSSGESKELTKAAKRFRRELETDMNFP